MNARQANLGAIVQAAVRLGWRQTSTRNDVVLISPDGGGARLALPDTGTMNASMFRRVWKTVFSRRLAGISDVDAANAIEHAMRDNGMRDEYQRQVWAAIGQVPIGRHTTPDDVADVLDAPPPDQYDEDEEEGTAPDRASGKVGDVMVRHSAGRHGDEQPDPDEVRLLSAEPWMASSDPVRGTRYASKAVLERRWSDGTVDYQCALCEWGNLNPRSVATHYGTTHRRGRGRDTQNPDVQVDEPSLSAAQERRIRRLAAELGAGIEAVGVDPVDLATYIIQARDERAEVVDGDVGDGLPEPVTVEELLDRIVGLAITAKAMPSQASLEAEQLRTDLLSANSRADDAEADLEALTAMLTERRRSHTDHERNTP